MNSNDFHTVLLIEPDFLEDSFRSESYTNAMIRYLKKLGINDVTLVLLKNNELDANFVSFTNPEIKDSIAKNFSDYNRKDDFLIINCNIPFLCDIELLYKSHVSSKNKATVAVKFSDDVFDNTEIVVDNDYNVVSVEHSNSFKKDGYVYIGITFVNSSLLFGNRLSESVNLKANPVPSVAYKTYEDIDGFQVKNNRRKALFLDRDGIINKDISYLYKKEDVIFCDGIFELCRSFVEHDYIIVVVTNQSGIARGFYTLRDTDILHSWMKDEFKRRGVDITDFFICPYHINAKELEYKKDSLLRKPNPGMLLKASEEWNIDLSKSVMIGDKPSDRIRLPYLKSYIKKSKYTEKDYNFVTFKELTATFNF